MKKYRILLFLFLGLALLVSVPQAFASPGSVAAQSTETETPTPTATVAPTETPNMATQAAGWIATRQAENPKRNRVHFRGTVSEATTADLILALSDGSSVTIGLDPRTLLVSLGEKVSRMNHIRPGSVVLVQAMRVANGNLVALVVLAMPVQPVRVHQIGKVTEYTPGVSITIQDQKGITYTYAITARTTIMPADRAASLATGAFVTVVSHKAPANENPNAIGIVILTSAP